MTTMTTQRWTLVEAAILHARTPAQTIGGTGNSLHSPRPLNPSEATELLSDDTPLKLALKLNIDVLEVATPHSPATGHGGTTRCESAEMTSTACPNQCEAFDMSVSRTRTSSPATRRGRRLPCHRDAPRNNHRERYCPCQGRIHRPGTHQQTHAFI